MNQYVLLGLVFLVAACSRNEFQFDGGDRKVLSARAGSCDQGVEVFKQTLFPFLRENCKDCHDLGGLGPAHSIDDPARAYGRIQTYINWNSIPESKIVTRVREKHWLAYPGEHPEVTPEQVIVLLQKWWEDGQKTCAMTGKYVSPPRSMPKTTESGYVKLHWPLKAISKDFDKSELELEAKVISGDGRGGFYLIRKPRLVTADVSVRVQGLHFLVNGRVEEMANNFEMIQSIAAPPLKDSLAPLLSSHTVELAFDPTADTDVAIAFDVLEVAKTPECKHLDLFDQNVQPVLEKRKCASCHAGGPNQPGSAPANAVYNMGQPGDLLCRSFLERLGGDLLFESPAISLPLSGGLGHPRVIFSKAEIDPWIQWLEAERAP